MPRLSIVNATNQTPAALGYRMPAEWEPHAATWIAWPHNRDDWPGKFSPVRWVYTEIVRHLSRVERVHIVVRGAAMKDAWPTSSTPSASTSSTVRFFKAATDRSWLRDTGPTFVVKDDPRSDGNATVGLVDWKFNGWAKYDNHDRDNRLPRKIARWLDATAVGAAHR